VTVWTCCEATVARGHRRGHYRQLYFLHDVYCPASLLRGQTVIVWAEERHLLYEIGQRWPAA
jgi:hypothetical protein